jgi:hypothetical protein
MHDASPINLSLALQAAWATRGGALREVVLRLVADGLEQN